MSKLIIIRGLPGSGKSTFAEKLYIDKEIDIFYEADMFFMHRGEYKYNPAQAGFSHAWCRRKVIDALKDGATVGVCNTFVTRGSVNAYAKLADKVIVYTMKNEFESIHGLPEGQFEKMAESWQDFDGEIIIKE